MNTLKKPMHRIISTVLAVMLGISCLPMDFMDMQVKAAASWNYGYTGGVQSFTAPSTGQYYIDMYGASGGGYIYGNNGFGSIGTWDQGQGGFGGHTYGYINLVAGQTIYLQVGQAGSVNGGATYNGGGASAYNGSGAGGGATSITTTNVGTLSAGGMNAVIAVAGGGGGRFSLAHMHNSIGSGGGSKGGATTSALSGTQTSGYKFGQGQNASVGGGGGGGYYGGNAATEIMHGGGGGSGYINGLYNATTSYSDHAGNGSISIEYKGAVQSSLTLNLGSGISYNGQTGKVVITDNYGTTKTISLSMASGYSFDGWTVNSGTFNPGNTLTFNYSFGGSNSELTAQYVAPLILRASTESLASKNYLTLTYEEDDNISKTIKLYEKVNDGSWIDLASSSYSFDNKFNGAYNYTGGVQTFTALAGGVYHITAYGAGGESGGTGVSGGNGARVDCDVKLNAGQKLYIYVGGSNGYNGGGAGTSNSSYGNAGTGGGATTVSTTSAMLSSLGNSTNAANYMLAVAGGGGGAGGGGSRGGAAYTKGAGGASGQTGSNGTIGNGGETDATQACMSGKGGTGATQNGAGVGGATGVCNSHAQDHDYYAGGGGGGGGGWYGGGGGGGGFTDYMSASNCYGYSGSNGSFGQGGAGGAGGFRGFAWHTGSGAGGGGGSSWLSSKVSSAQYYSNQRSGNGYCTITLNKAGDDLDETGRFGVYALDTVAPNIPSSNSIGTGDNTTVRLNWNDVDDNGVTYTFKAISYRTSNGAQLRESGEVSTKALSGLKGYHYYLDNNPTGTATPNNAFTYNNYIDVSGDTIVNYRYVHVCAIDNVGNYSGTYNFPIPLGAIISFNKNDSLATGSMSNQLLIYGSTANLTANAYSKPGYTFKGWNTKSDGTGTAYSNSELVSYVSMVNRHGYSIVLYAQWESNKYNLHVDKNGGSGGSNDTNMSYGSFIDLIIPIRTGYDFTSWKITQDDTIGSSLTGSILNKCLRRTYTYSNRFTMGYNKNYPYTTYVSSPSVTVQAQWSPHQYYVQFAGNLATSGSVATITCVYDNTYQMPKNGFVRDNFVFTGWNTKQDGSGSSYQPGDNFANLSSVDNEYVTMYAQWVPNALQVGKLYVDPNGGEYKGTKDVSVYTYTPSLTDSKTFYYTGGYQTYVVPYDGYYFIEAAGGQGGNEAAPGGKGGFVKSYIYLKKGQTLYVSVGQSGWCSGGEADLPSNPTYGAGGRTACNWDNTIFSGVGGGATIVATALYGNGDIRYYSGDKNSILVAAGGGGGGSNIKAGEGGTVLYAGSGSSYSVVNGASTSLLNGVFGLGSNHSNAAGRVQDGGAGGGGWIGGIVGWDDIAGDSGSGGGASFVNTSRGCYDYALIPGYQNGHGVVKITPFNTDGMHVLSPDPTRVGWTFNGWQLEPNSDGILYHNEQIPLWFVDYRKGTTRVTAKWYRDVILNLSSDVVSKRDGSSYKQTIYDPPTKYFTFDSYVNGFVDNITRVNGQYLVTFELNNTATSVTNLVNKGNTATSTPLNLVTRQITAYPTFRGWSTQGFIPGEYLGTYPGVVVGNSGTVITIKPYVDDAYLYDVTGNVNTAVVRSTNKSITLYPQWNRTNIVLPDATRNEGNVGNGKAPDYFLGWFTKPQLDKDTIDGGAFVGYAGDTVYVDRDITLYPWFNIAPKIVQSEIVNNLTNPFATDTNMFWEGQSISYEQLLSLINASDADNHYVSPSKNGEIEWNGLNSWKDLYALNVESYMNAYLLEHYPDMTISEHNAAVQLVRTRLSTYRNNYNGVDTVDFEPVLVSITYKANGTDSDGNVIPNAQSFTQTLADIKANGLNTNVENIGDITLHYEITDNGSFDYYNDKYIWSVNGYKVDSPITVKFDLNTRIAFDEAPVLETKNAIIYTRDPQYTADTIGQYLIDKQLVSDFEDDYNNVPWWISNSLDSTQAYVTNTRENLVNSKSIETVKDIEFQSGFENENLILANQIKSITDIKELFALKDSSDELKQSAFDHITAFKVVIDCEDQWGKKASAGRCGQNEVERTTQVILFNDEDDYDIAVSAIDERIRYIDSDWTHTLGDTSYWSDMQYGKLSLNSTFTRYLERNGLAPNVYGGSVVNKTIDDTGRTIAITINDYSE